MATFLTTLSNVKTSELEIACKKEQKNGILAFLRTGQQTISGTFIHMHSYIFQSTKDSNVSKNSSMYLKTFQVCILMVFRRENSKY